MPSPRGKRSPGTGLYCDVMACEKPPHRIQNSARGVGDSTKQENGFSPSRFSPGRASDGFSSQPFSPGGGWSDEGGLRRELAVMKMHLAAILEGQVELQTAIEKIGSNLSLVAAQGAPQATKANDIPLSIHASPSLRDSKGSANPGIAGHKLSRQASGFVSKAEQERLDEAERKRNTLERMFQKAELVWKLEEDANKRRRLGCCSALSMWWKEVRGDSEKFGMFVDIVSSLLIVANAFFLGVAMDYDDGSLIWMMVNLCFTIMFLLELVCRIYSRGLCGHFCDKDNRFMNALDFFLISIDCVQVYYEWNNLVDEDAAGAPSASLFRMIRLVKLARLVRVLKSDVFKELGEMIHGILAGVYTLVWSIALFCVVIYVVALVFRETLGREDRENIFELFETVPRSMFTTFRCSLGDCTSKKGVPIFEFVLRDYGVGLSLFYSLFVFTVAIVLFNVISAMFVESTMTAANHLHLLKKRARMQDDGLLCTRIATLTKRILVVSPDHNSLENGVSMADQVDAVASAEVPREVIDEVIHDPEAKQALVDLDINPLDHARLSDIFDPDNGGTVGVLDIAAGIRRLRGDARRSDVVCLDLMIRSMQAKVDSIMDVVCEVRDTLPPTSNEAERTARSNAVNKATN
eukprot:TRINITY_DN31757_c0_g1_i1.p1 TRINITY_DN31757_c0_g1~~TRINITY_DN31757_c0_g1_i1.p1  ORF type:complete len:647 (+),score=88.02 TRINITY_DN31757_c0_g1_i1:38-1942(+)